MLVLHKYKHEKLNKKIYWLKFTCNTKKKDPEVIQWGNI